MTGHASADRRRRRGDFWALVGCNGIVFGASVCIMVLELTASRLIAAYLGSSLYTWTSVIGVVLAGISIGNYLGGWLADRYQPQKTLAWLFLIAGLSTFSVLLLNTWAAATRRPAGWDWQWWVMAVVAWVFLAPALALGTISPVVASMALKRSAKTGITVGNIYAWGAMGSIVGTFLAGFWLIGAFGTRQIVVMTASALILMGALVAGGQRALRVTLLLGALQFVGGLGLCAAVTAEQMGAACRAVAGIASGWSTGPQEFEKDREAISAAIAKNDEPALKAARGLTYWRSERREVENAWGDWGRRLGGDLQQVGLTLALRSDRPDEYFDESDYYTISVAESKEDGEPVKQLRLDYLIHSYYNPRQPTKLHYDYERVYAAITERAAESWSRRTGVILESPPLAGVFADILPDRVAWEAGAKRLSIVGGMSVSQLRQLLLIGADGEFREALLTLWQRTSENWDRIAGDSGEAVERLSALPEGVAFPDQFAVQVHYDEARHELVCKSPFGLEQAFALMAQGREAGFVGAVADLWRRSRRISTLFIGGGGYIFPRWIESTFPDDPQIDVAEIDPAVQQAVERMLGLPTAYGPPRQGKTYVRTHIGDARKYVDERLLENASRQARGTAPKTCDFVYGDAFNDLSVPWHLTTVEFSSHVRDLLTPNQGVFLVNIIDIYPRAKFAVSSPDDKGEAAQAVAADSASPAVPEPPEALFARPIRKFAWVAASGGFSQLQVMDAGQGKLIYGYRGVMSDARRDSLLAAGAGNESFCEAIRGLSTRSREEPVGQFLGRYVNTVRDVFPYVYVFSSNEDEPGESRDTFVVACSLMQLDFDSLLSSGGHWMAGPFAWSEADANGTRNDSGDMPALLELSRGLKLTDDYAPVDNLLAPVFVSRSDD